LGTKRLKADKRSTNFSLYEPKMSRLLTHLNLAIVFVHWFV